MQTNSTPSSHEIQEHDGLTPTKYGASRSSSAFRPVTKLRVMLTPPVKERIVTRYFKLQQGIRKIAKDEKFPESVVEQITREKYWDSRRDDNGPTPTGGAMRPSRFGGGMLDVGAGYKRAA
jgi:hypothetical protein